MPATGLRIGNFVLPGSILGSIFLAACGGGGSCPAVAACGGDVVASWEIQDYCTSGQPPNEFQSQCKGASVSVSGIGASGTLTYSKDGTYSSSIALRGTMHMEIPQSCLQGLSCSALDSAFKRTFTDPDSPFSSVSCSGSGSCTCAIQFSGRPNMGRGTYRTANNQIIQNGDQILDYCVGGDELRFQAAMMMPGIMASMMGEEMRFSARAVRK